MLKITKKFSSVGKKIYEGVQLRIVKCDNDQHALDAAMLLAYDAGRAAERRQSSSPGAMHEERSAEPVDLGLVDPRREMERPHR